MDLVVGRVGDEHGAGGGEQRVGGRGRGDSRRRRLADGQRGGRQGVGAAEVGQGDARHRRFLCGADVGVGLAEGDLVRGSVDGDDVADRVGRGVEDVHVAAGGAGGETPAAAGREPERHDAGVDRDPLDDPVSRPVDDDDLVAGCAGHIDVAVRSGHLGGGRGDSDVDVGHHAELRRVHHRQRAGVAVGDVGERPVRRERNLVVAVAGGDGGDGRQPVRVDDGDPAQPVAGVVADPDVAAVGRQRHPHRVGPDRHVVEHGEGVEVGDGHLTVARDRDDHALAVAGLHPVLAGAPQQHHG